MFQISSRRIGDQEPFAVLPKKSGETYALGEALTLTANGVTKCGATTMPAYICMGLGDSNGLVCIPALETTEYEVGYTAAPAVGARVTLHTDGLSITATTTDGVFTVTSVDTTAGKARGYFK